jgi:DNA polymerase-1
LLSILLGEESLKLMDDKIPLRSMLVASPGYTLIECDLAQAEAWVVAYLANEPTMKDALLNGDIHTKTATVIFEVEEAVITKDMRFLGKKSNHAFNYKQGPFKAAETINKESDKPPYITVNVKQTKKFRENYLKAYQIESWWFSIEEELRRGRTLITPYGRSRTFYGFWGEDLFKEAIAFRPQSTVGDHALGLVQRELGISGGVKSIYYEICKPSSNTIRILNTSHDSAIVECPTPLVSEIAPQIVAKMHRPILINGEECLIPVDCKVGERWGELEKFKVA